MSTKRRGATACVAWCSPAQHVIGFHGKLKRWTPTRPRRPDKLLRAVQVVRQDMAQFADRYGIEP